MLRGNSVSLLLAKHPSSLPAGVDVVYSGSQKVLGAPPSTAPISFSPRARDKMAARKTKVQSFYFDMEWLAQYWGVDNSPRVYVGLKTMWDFVVLALYPGAP